MEITQEYLQECFSYNPETGVLTWKKRPRDHFNTDRGFKIFNSNYAHNEAGSSRAYTENLSYILIVIKGRRFLAHRIIWALNCGDWPHDEIDHIDGDGLNNTIANLRAVSHQENLKNRKINKNNASKISGVRWDSERQKWFVQIGAQNKVLKLGRYLDKFEASCVRKSAELKYGYHKNNGRK